jgi:hypothetical protein
MSLGKRHIGRPSPVKWLTLSNAILAPHAI